MLLQRLLGLREVPLRARALEGLVEVPFGVLGFRVLGFGGSRIVGLMV